MSQIGRDDNQEVVRAKLGIEAEMFEHSALGRYLLERADLDRALLSEELIAKDPEDIDGCKAVRNKILVIDLFIDFLTEVKNSGHAAEILMEEQEAYENE